MGRNVDAWSRFGPFLSEQEALIALLPTVGGYENSPTGHVASYSSGKVSLPEVAGTADLRKLVNGSAAAFLDHPESMLLSAEDYAAQESALGPAGLYSDPMLGRSAKNRKEFNRELLDRGVLTAIPVSDVREFVGFFFVTKKMAGFA